MAALTNSTKNLIPVLFKLSPKIRIELILPDSFYEATITLKPKPDKETIRKENGPISLMNVIVKICNTALPK